MTKLTIGTSRTPNGEYEGVIRRGRTIAARCGHTHRNRDQSTGANGVSAYHCVRSLIKATRLSDLAKERRAGFREAETRVRRLYGAMSLPPGMPTAADRIAAFDAQLEELRRIIGCAPVYGLAGSVVLPAVRKGV